MGYSITQETAEKLDANRRNNRLCASGHRYCTSPATYEVTTLAWVHEVNVGEAHESGFKLCTRHSKEYRDGTVNGRNFLVMAVNKLGPLPLFQLVGVGSL